MSQLAQEVDPGLAREAHVRAGEQWMMADEPQPAADEFTAAIEDGGLVSAEARVHLARALFGLDREAEAELLLAGLTAERERSAPRTCDLLAELFTEQGDLRRAQDWATVGSSGASSSAMRRSCSCCSASGTASGSTSASARTTTTACSTARPARPEAQFRRSAEQDAQPQLLTLLATCPGRTRWSAPAASPPPRRYPRSMPGTS